MSEFIETKKLILKNLEHGDRKEIAKNVGVSHPIMKSALDKCCISDMSLSERKAWIGCVEFVRDKIKERERIEKSTLKVAERL